MAHPYHHALASQKNRGGAVEDFLPIQSWFDASKRILADFRHRALRHHAEGVFMAETIFGAIITLSSGRVIPTRWIGEQHMREDLGRIPSFADWARAIRPEPWMGRATRLEDRLDPAPADPLSSAQAAQPCRQFRSTAQPASSSEQAGRSCLRRTPWRSPIMSARISRPCCAPPKPAISR